MTDDKYFENNNFSTAPEKYFFFLQKLLKIQRNEKFEKRETPFIKK